MNKLSQYILGHLSASIAFPLAERIEKRDIQSKVRKIEKYYAQKFSDRKKIMQMRLADIAEFAGVNVPYYRDLFLSSGFNPSLIRKDIAYLQDLPFLTKEIVREQGFRLLSQNLERLVHYKMKTGGSTGPSAYFFYDQLAADYSSAATLYARGHIGKKKYQFELHFASKFPEITASPKWSREDWKCLAMNRSNIFIDKLDDQGLEKILKVLQEKRPKLIHGHPSTIYALSNHIKNTGRLGVKFFDLFESSGELLEPYQRENIEKFLQCKVVDRYGLAEFGIVAYELNGPGTGLMVLESEGYPESFLQNNGDENINELVFSGFKNKLMPLLRYRTGDLAQVVEKDNCYYLNQVSGRIHDLVPINGTPYSTSYIMDILDHRVGGIQEFQIDLRYNKPILKIVLEIFANKREIHQKILDVFGVNFEIQFLNIQDLIRVGHHSKFRHVVHP